MGRHGAHGFAGRAHMARDHAARRVQKVVVERFLGGGLKEGAALVAVAQPVNHHLVH